MGHLIYHPRTAIIIELSECWRIRNHLHLSHIVSLLINWKLCRLCLLDAFIFQTFGRRLSSNLLAKFGILLNNLLVNFVDNQNFLFSSFSLMKFWHFLICLFQIFFQQTLKSVFNSVFRSSRHLIRYHRPFLTMLNYKLQQSRIFFACPWASELVNRYTD